MIVSNSCSIIKGSKGVDDVIKDFTDYFQKNFTDCKSFNSMSE